MISTIWGNDPPELVMAKASGGGGHTHNYNTYYNPRMTVYFADYPPEMGEISDNILYNILGATLRRGEFYPSYDGPVSDPPQDGWSGDAHEQIRWNGDKTIDVKFSATISLGRQQFQQVDAELFVKQNGTAVQGLTTISSLNRMPSGLQGSTTMTLTGYLTLDEGDTLEFLLHRVGFNEVALTQLNIVSAQVDITALKNNKEPGIIFT